MSDDQTSDLTDDELREVERRYADSTPKRPCPVCGATDWSLQAIGGGRESWVCRGSLAEHHGGHAGNRQDWEHYRASHREQASGDYRIAALIAEVRRRRAADKSSTDYDRRIENAAMEDFARVDTCGGNLR